MKEEEGEERSSHRLSIRVYHSSMQCGVWPRPLETRPERLYHSCLGVLMSTVHQLSNMASSLVLFYLIFSTLHTLFFLHHLLKNMNIDGFSAVCVGSLCVLCELISPSI